MAAPHAYLARLSVALNNDQAGYLEIPVPKDFDDGPKMGDWVLRSRDGAFVSFHPTIPRATSAGELESRAELIAGGVVHLRLNLGESCGEIEVRRLNLAEGWSASYADIQCRRRAQTRFTAVAVSGPGLTFDVFSTGMPFEKLEEILTDLRIVRMSQSRAPMLGATRGLDE